jgi:hypothetical protein
VFVGSLNPINTGLLYGFATFFYPIMQNSGINYQGKLTNATGSPVPDGNHDVEFKIYDVQAGGSALWTETWDSSTSQIVTKGGVFNAMLGTHNPLPLTLFSDYPVTYLGITVGTDSEMTPRQRITSVGYAFTAGNAETASNGVPQGAIIMWSGSIAQIPAGWALCDGTNGTPDLRSRFIVGAGTGGTYNVGDKSQSLSYTINLAHTHIINSTDINHTHNDDHRHSGTTGTENKKKEVDNSNEVNQDNVTDDGHSHGFTTNLKSEASFGNTTGLMNQNNSHSHSENSQLSSSQDIRPPYFALAFIIKL